MTYRPSKETLKRQGSIKKCPVDRKAIENLLGRAEIDLKTARRNLDDDPECAHTYAYRAMLRSGQALMLSNGYRPEIPCSRMEAEHALKTAESFLKIVRTVMQ